MAGSPPCQGCRMLPTSDASSTQHWEAAGTQSGSKGRLPTWREELKADGCICSNSGQCKSVLLGKVWEESWLSMEKDR